MPASPLLSSPCGSSAGQALGVYQRRRASDLLELGLELELKLEPGLELELKLGLELELELELELDWL